MKPRTTWDAMLTRIAGTAAVLLGVRGMTRTADLDLWILLWCGLLSVGLVLVIVTFEPSGRIDGKREEVQDGPVLDR